MTTTITSSRAPSSTVGVPTTQNTAPIVEYRCLYSHDLKRKQKRWQDGVLRFHTFNKRVMVYDVPRNYVGDTHWRDSNPVQDGDEFKLDRGVLIQVGEETGSMEQNLAGLLEKRKKAPDVPVNVDLASRPTEIVDTNSVPSHPSQALRPKPLNAVLGPSRGLVGRASLPTKSPYDQRIAAEKPSWQQRPAKRQRVQTETETSSPPLFSSADVIGNKFLPPVNVRAINNSEHLSMGNQSAQPAISAAALRSKKASVASHQTTTTPATASFAKEQAITSKRRNGDTPQRRTAETAPVYMLSSQEEASLPAPPVPKKKLKTRKANPEMQIPSKALDTETSTTLSRRSSRTSSTATTLEPNPKASGTREVRGRLLMAARKPRRKLMYRDLLPPSPNNRLDESVDPTLMAFPSRERGVPAKGVEVVPRSLSSLHQEERNWLDERLERCLARESTKSPECQLEDLRKRRDRTHDDEDSMSARRNRPRSPDIIDQSIPKIKPKDHNTNDVLSRMDEVLISYPGLARVPSRSNHPLNTFFHENPPTTLGEAIAVNRSAEEALQQLPVETHCKTQVPSSPPKEIPPQFLDPSLPHSTRPTSSESPQEPATAHSSYATTTPTIEAVIPLSQPVPLSSQAPYHSPTYPPEASTTAPPITKGLPLPPPQPKPEILPPPQHLPAPANAFPSPEDAPFPKNKTLPTFKQPTRHSPLKKAHSDSSFTRPLAEAGTSRPVDNASRSGTDPEAAAQIAEPWSNEIWDLFGCARDGVKCDFREFIGKKTQREGMG